MIRSAGILMHISSLPSKYGIGTLGKEAYKFADFLKMSGQKYWQILPIGQTSYGDSPYQSLSSYAGNPYFIDFDILEKDGLLKKEEYKFLNWGEDSLNIDYAKIFNLRFKILKLAYNRSKGKNIQEFLKFQEDNSHWLIDYSLYMAVKSYFGLKSWIQWDDDIKFRKPIALKKYKELLKEDIEFYKYIQFLFFKQWKQLKKYVNSLGISIIGDMPIYVALDSADTWANSEFFWLDTEKKPVCVAGCPPDEFSKTGQLWGNPLYNWKYLKEKNYKWWIDRLKGSKNIFDILRIDHFRGFDEYYAIPGKDDTAKNGTWMKGPGIDLFKTIDKKIKGINIISEDLGFMTNTVIKLLKDTGYPGMKIIQFAFSGEKNNAYSPHNYDKNYVVYTGTHDNNTIMGWLEDISENELNFAKEYSNLNKKEGYNWGLIRLAYSSVANICIIPIQDFLGLGSEARMNFPSTLGGNWTFRIEKKMLTLKLSKKIKTLTRIYER